VSSLERDSLLTFYYLSGSKIWTNKRGVLWWEKRSTTVL